MPRARTATAPDDIDASALAGLDGLPSDPAPAATPRRRGRPPGSTTKKTTIPARRSNGTVMSRAEMIDAVKGQVMMIVLPLATVWELRDPDCAAVLSEPVGQGETRLEAIVDRLMTMVARNASVLEFMAKNTLLLDAGMLVTLLTPILKTVWKAHGPSGTGHGETQEQTNAAYERDFPAYNPAASRPAFAG